MERKVVGGYISIVGESMKEKKFEVEKLHDTEEVKME